MDDKKSVTIMLAGDVMTGRGIDQILAHPSDPTLYESYVKSAADYVRLAERANGPIPRPVMDDYPWKSVVTFLGRRWTDARIVNLETAVTKSDHPWPKGINYRMNPANIGCLKAAGIECCVLANNHVMDWGVTGLVDSVTGLTDAGLFVVGAGVNASIAASAAILPVTGGRRILVYAAACPSSGVPPEWAATGDRPGVNYLGEADEAAADAIAARIARDRRPGDIVVFSIHWGPNWGYDIDPGDRRFAHRLIETAGVDIVHGHSSHHPKAVEVHRGKLILHGCGDFLNDYEGIENHEPYRDDLVLMYLAELGSDGRLQRLDMVPFRIKNFALVPADAGEAEWLRRTMDRECRRFGAEVRSTGDADRTLSLMVPA
jgi:poly-gamma-glutamate synthesis protein (capsule biosynthesis protein)